MRKLFIVSVSVGSIIGSLIGVKAAPRAAGCSNRRASAHHPGSRTVRAARAPVACAMYTGYPAEESKIGVSKDGTVFYSPVISLNDPNASAGVVVSTDHGAHWRALFPKVEGLPLHFPGDPYVYVDHKTSRVFFVSLFQPTQCGSVISWSDDRGRTWDSSIAGCPLMDNEKLFAGAPVASHPNGYPNVVYYCAMFPVVTMGTMVGCEKSLDGAKSFSLTGFPYPPSANPGEGGVPGLCNAAIGTGAVGPDGTVYLPKGWCGEPYIAISRDEGATWQRVRVSTLGMPDVNGEQDTEAAVGTDARGTVYYAWVANNRLPYLAISNDHGLHWSKPMMVAAPGVKETSLAELAVGAPGKVALTYLGSTNSPGPPFTRSYDHVTFNGYMTESADALSADPTFYTATANDPRDPLILGCAPPACNVSELTRIDYIGVDIGPDGSVWGGFADGCTGSCARKHDAATALVGLVGRLVGGPNLAR